MSNPSDSKELFDAILSGDVFSAAATPSSAVSNAEAVRKTIYKTLVSHGNLISYSQQEVLHACPRLFQIQKLRAATSEVVVREPNLDFAFGHAVGAGVATFDQTRDLDQAIWAASLAWDIDLLTEEPEPVEGRARKNRMKTFPFVVEALERYQVFYYEHEDLHEYDSKKVEAVVGVDMENGFFYTGHVDEILQHREYGTIRIKENKTTSFAAVDPAMYSNSDQALSYAVVVDALEAADYAVLYCIYSSTERRWMTFDFVKSANAKAEWVLGQTMLNSEVQMYEDYNHFPRRGGSCLRFNRRCNEYENCDMVDESVYGTKFSKLPKITSLDHLDSLEHLDFRVKLSDLVSHQREKL